MNTENITKISHEQLMEIITRAERILSERELVNGDLKELMAEAKSSGFDTKTIRKILRLRKLDPVERAEEEAMLELYLSAIEK